MNEVMNEQDRLNNATSELTEPVDFKPVSGIFTLWFDARQAGIEDLKQRIEALEARVQALEGGTGVPCYDEHGNAITSVPKWMLDPHVRVELVDAPSPGVCPECHSTRIQRDYFEGPVYLCTVCGVTWPALEDD